MKIKSGHLKWRRKSGTFIALLSGAMPVRSDQDGTADAGPVAVAGELEVVPSVADRANRIERSSVVNQGRSSLLSTEAALIDDLPAEPILPVAETAPAHAVRVLIVDDVAMNRDVAASILRAAGHDVTCVSSGAKAIAAIGITAFDVVLMDVRMPEMDGLEATRHIRAMEGRRGLVPIVALTAQDFPAEIEACRRVGMNGHVAKPFDPDTLAAAVLSATLVKRPQGDSREPGFVTLSLSALTDREVGPELQLIDLDTFKRTASFLTRDAVGSYLRKISALAKTLLLMLDGPEVPEFSGNEFAGAAHMVAGTAGMFGFERLTAASREFERATESGASEAPKVAEALGVVIRETLPEIRSRILAAADA